MNDAIKGYILGAIAAASYGTNPLFAVPLLKAGIDAYSVLFLRYMFAIPILALIMIVRGRGFGLRKGQVLPLVALGWAMAFSSFTLYISYAYLGTAIASTLLFIYPILVTVIMAVFFKERASMQTIGCIALATCGIAMLYKGDDEGTLSTAGLLLVFLSALTYAVYMVAVNSNKIKEIPTLKLTLYVITFGLFLFAFRFDVHSINILCSDFRLWMYAFALALFPTAVSLLCTSISIQKIGSTPVAVLGALEPVTAVLFAVTVFDEQLTTRLLVGIVMIITAVTLIIAGGKINTQLLRVRRMFPRIKRKK